MNKELQDTLRHGKEAKRKLKAYQEYYNNLRKKLFKYWGIKA